MNSLPASIAVVLPPETQVIIHSFGELPVKLIYGALAGLQKNTTFNVVNPKLIGLELGTSVILPKLTVIQWTYKNTSVTEAILEDFVEAYLFSDTTATLPTGTLTTTPFTVTIENLSVSMPSGLTLNIHGRDYRLLNNPSLNLHGIPVNIPASTVIDGNTIIYPTLIHVTISNHKINGNVHVTVLDSNEESNEIYQKILSSPVVTINNGSIYLPAGTKIPADKITDPNISSSCPLPSNIAAITATAATAATAGELVFVNQSIPVTLNTSGKSTTNSLTINDKDIFVFDRRTKQKVQEMTVTLVSGLMLTRPSNGFLIEDIKDFSLNNGSPVTLSSMSTLALPIGTIMSPDLSPNNIQTVVYPTLAKVVGESNLKGTEITIPAGTKIEILSEFTEFIKLEPDVILNNIRQDFIIDMDFGEEDDNGAENKSKSSPFDFREETGDIPDKAENKPESSPVNSMPEQKLLIDFREETGNIPDKTENRSENIAVDSSTGEDKTGNILDKAENKPENIAVDSSTKSQTLLIDFREETGDIPDKVENRSENIAVDSSTGEDKTGDIPDKAENQPESSPVPAQTLLIDFREETGNIPEKAENKPESSPVNSSINKNGAGTFPEKAENQPESSPVNSMPAQTLLIDFREETGIVPDKAENRSENIAVDSSTGEDKTGNIPDKPENKPESSPVNYLKIQHVLWSYIRIRNTQRMLRRKISERI